MKKYIKITAIARGSQLSQTQTLSTINKLGKLFKNIEFSASWVSTTGDSNRTTDLRVSAQDFFTDTLDKMILAEEADIAVHSAKDLPNELAEGLDFFWLPWREDPRDCIILRKGLTLRDNCIFDNDNKLISNPIVGVSSDRREEYSLSRFKSPELRSIRGNIDERLAQLHSGKYDILIMAVAALNRLGIQDEIYEYIPLTELPAPAGQGYIAITYKKGNSIIEEIKRFFIKQVIFAGGGPGNPNLAPLATIEALKVAEICLFDALAPKELLEYIPKSAKTIFVGKRNKVHSKKQTEINKLISFYAKQGKRVVRLKGGDPGIYGRLSEEVNEMEENRIPFTVIPALSSFIAATTTSGLLLTRRSLSRGFRVITPRRENSEDYHKLNYNDFTETPLVYFMAITKVKDIVAELIENGVSPKIESAIFYSVGTDNEEVITAPLSEIEKYAIDTHPQKGPGLLVVGKVMNPKYIFPNNGLFANKRILVTGSEVIQKKSKEIIEANGGKYINHQLVKLRPMLDVSDKLLFEYDYIILTSPTAVKMFMKQIYSNKIDIRKIPQIISCGQGTTNEFVKHNIFPEITAENDFGSKGIIESIKNKVSKDKKILKLSSNLASTEITAFLSENGNSFDDFIFYKNESICNNDLKEFDTIYFASSSAVEAFFEYSSELSLINKDILVIGEPTKKKLMELVNGKISIIMGDIATTEGVFDSYKVKLIENNILKSKNKGEN